MGAKMNEPELAFDSWLSQVDEITIRQNSRVIPREWQISTDGYTVCVTESKGFSEAVGRGLTQLWSRNAKALTSAAQLNDAVQPPKLGD